MKKLSLLLTTVAVLLGTLIPLAFAAEKQKSVAVSKQDLSLKLEVENAIGKGLSWLALRQNPAGHWSQPEYPALSALVLTSFQGDPSGFYKRKYEPQIGKGYRYLLSNVRPDGGIYGKDLANYNTSISMMALLMSNNPEYEPVLKRARGFLIGLQDKRGDQFDGGIGYGGSYKNSDIVNTSFALEALHYTRYLKSDVAGEAEDLDWKAVVKFISRTQNLPGYNDQKWATGDAESRGGFVYFPGDSKAGDKLLPDGRVALRSYGSGSYAGLLSYIYAQMDKNDPRVKEVYNWLNANYTLEENPGMGQEGLYYYYHTMAKALSTYGVDSIKLKNGKTVSWRTDLAKRFLDLQKEDGSWVNPTGRWWERDPVLVTSYAVLTLEILYRGL
ncbi:prenyltransferase/squalene oxidase repeat-containing protein [Citrifermentans bremense]|uniref:prenyltransferase/squalene oxidase repeat-containing protein n=1 Tax=Citrifermentans bremense TaxID=60035 RepID=UPI000413CC47|nr:prenyltransferase/squalene oxidase repeat-containing protein [Citrifermentans bremense]